jgi:hypothetical protein
MPDEMWYHAGSQLGGRQHGHGARMASRRNRFVVPEEFELK